MEPKSKKTVIKVVTDYVNPMDITLLAESIKKVADNMSKVLGSGLSIKALCILIQASMTQKEKIPLVDIERVLLHASNLRKFVTK